MNIIILTNGTYQDMAFYQQYILEAHADYIICADGGANYARELKLKPDLILGDMDSIDEETKAFYRETAFLSFPTQKDETDTELAITYAIKNNATKVTILGGLGSRMDHSLANIYLLKRLFDENIEAEIVNEKNVIRLIGKKDTFEFPIGTVISLLPIGGDVEELTISGFEYPINNGKMTMNNPYGVSNVTNQAKQVIDFKKGMLVMILPKD